MSAGAKPSVTTAWLGVRTPWSFHHGAATVDDLAVGAAALGIGVLGMADAGGMWGAVPFQKACLAHGIKPVFGVRLGPAHLIALNQDGWGALCRLSTRWLSTPEIEREWGLAARIGAEGGGFAVLSANAPLLRQLRSDGACAELWASSLEAATDSGLPLIAVPTVVAARKQGMLRHRLLCAIGANTTLQDLTVSDTAPDGAWLRSQEELRMRSDWNPGAWANAADLAERAEFEIALGQKRMPRFPVPAGRSAVAQLARLCQRGIRRRRLHRHPKYTKYQAQLRRELALIEEQDFADYFLVVADLVQWSRAHDIHCCGRGSAANSLVSWLLGFTQVDPLEHGLYFERFMNRGRTDFPDVDLDFAWDERDLVLNQAFERWGHDRLALISTHITFAARGAVRELAKVMGLPPAEIGEFTRALPWHGGDALEPAALSRNPLTRDLPITAEPWATILREASALQGFPRHTGVHPGGTVLAPAPLTDFLPLQHAKKQTERGPLTVTQWDMYAVEEVGLVKIDLLGNRGLAVVRDAAAMVKINTGLVVDFARIRPERDTRTCRLLAAGDSMGCFYVESPGMRGLLRKLECADFATLVAASSIIRPGIAQSGMMRAYIERHHQVRAAGGRHDPDWYLHPCMRELLAETYGVMTYQEDVMKVAQAVSGFDAACADQLRRAMSRKRNHRQLQSWGERFVDGAIANGCAEQTARELWRQIESFSGYSFCKAHSASYAMVSFRSAWLRAHFPAEFMAAVLRNHGGFYSSFAYVEEARRMGLRLRLPCVNNSQAGFLGSDGSLSVGLSEIDGLSTASMHKLMNERAHGLFSSQAELCTRLDIGPNELEALIRAGALDALGDGYTRPERMRAAAIWARRRHPELLAEGSLFHAGGVVPSLGLRRPPAAPEYDRRTQLLQEWGALGFVVSAHPLALYADTIRKSQVTPACELSAQLGRRVCLVGWQVTQKPVRTKNGKPMLFLSFEDTTAIYETVMWPRVYRRLAPWTLTQGPYLVFGVPRDEHGVITVEVDNLKLLDDSPHLVDGRRQSTAPQGTYDW